MLFLFGSRDAPTSQEPLLANATAANYNRGVNKPQVSPENELKTLQHRRDFYVLALSAIILGGAWLRCWQATESLWLDELHTSWVVASGAGDVLPRAQAGNQSPLYFYLEWFVVQICGQSAVALRLISLLSGIGLVGVVGWLVSHWTGSRSAALLASLLVALNRDCIFYAQEARPYALVQLAATAHGALFVTMLTRPTWRARLAFVGGAICLLYLHYTTFLLLLGEAVCWALLTLWHRVRVEYRWTQAAVDSLLVALALLPSTMHLLSIVQHRDNWSRIVHAWPLPYAFQVMWLLFGLVPVVTLIVAGVWRGSRKGLENFMTASVPSVWSACWFAVPMLAAWMATFSSVAALFMVRYLVASVVGGIVFAALCHAAVNARLPRVFLALVLVAGTVATSGMVPQFRFDGRFIGDRNEAWDEAVAWLDQQLQGTRTPLFLCAGLLEDEELSAVGPSDELVEYCLFPVRGVYRLDSGRSAPLPTSSRAEFSDRQCESIARQHGCWLLIRATEKTTRSIVQALSEDLRRRGMTVETPLRQHFGTLTVVRMITE